MDKINLDGLQLAKGGGQGYWLAECTNPECDVITFQMVTNDVDSPSQILCPGCNDIGYPGYKIGQQGKKYKCGEVE